MSGCGNCGINRAHFGPDDLVAAGFGSAGLYRDGVMVIDGDARAETDEPLTGAECERIASADPGHKWEIVIAAALHGDTFERQPDGRWPCTASNNGFA